MKRNDNVKMSERLIQNTEKASVTINGEEKIQKTCSCEVSRPRKGFDRRSPSFSQH